jgi:hypothetical protein
MAPDDWIAAVEPRFRPMLPNDATSEPMGRALDLGRLLGKYAASVVFSTCTSEGACTQYTVQVSQIAYDEVLGLGYTSATRSSRYCSPRFIDGVSTWTPADDAEDFDVPLTETTGGITTIEFDGFDGAYDSTASNPWHAWEDPFTQAFTSGSPVLVDARQGHGGHFSLGDWLASQIRSKSDPYAAFAVPRGDYDDIDPSWLFDSSLAACVFASESSPNLCGWTGGDIDESYLASPPGAAVQIAWVDSNDLSMNDIVPKKIAEAPNVRIFGPHPTTGAYGERSELPPIVGPWTSANIQTLDMRFGATLPSAMSAAWASGVGVPPDQIVTQKVSDILAGNDTVLEAARAWLVP